MTNFQLHCDPKSRSVTRYTLRPKEGLHLQSETQTPGQWRGLHVALGPLNLDQAALIGFHLKNRAPSAISYRACLRSGLDDGFVDHFFDLDIVAYNAPVAHTDLLRIEEQRRLPRQAPWREFILFLPTQSFELQLSDLRLFAA